MLKFSKNVNINGSPYLVVDVWVPRGLNTIAGDSLHLVEVKDSLMSYIKNSQVRIVYPDYETRLHTRANVISPYMAWITNNRTFTDIGDDNRDGWLDPDPEVQATERMLK